MRSLVTYSGIILRHNSRGPAVKAVQRALKVEVDGWYGPRTKRAMKRWQSAHGLRPSGGVNRATWRALLADHAPTR
jgi:peptidoglycan hydrolase-like protein with peptidoglycan-binding domain